MAKFVIAGSCECPYFAKLELLACQLAVNLPHFNVHKITLPADEWPSWLSEICEKNGWQHEKSPIVWRELVERGGKGHLLGGFNEFCEYAKCYYGVESSMMTELMLSVKDENIHTCSKDIEEKEQFKSSSKPIHVCIVNAISPIAYHLIPQIASGNVFGSEIEISIRLLDSQSNVKQLEGVVMETEDLAFPLLRKMTVCTDENTAMENASAVIFLEDDDSPEADDSRNDLLLSNAERFRNYAQVLDEVALSDAKVIVAGNGPINFSTYVLLENLSKLNKENVVASPRLQDRRARAILSRWLKVNSNDVKDVLILGNCSNNAPENSSLITIDSASVHNYDGAIWGPGWYARPLNEMVYDRDWLKGDFISTHRDHDTNLTKSLKHSAAMSEAASLATLLRDWIEGTPGNEITSLGVLCKGDFDINDCVFSLPGRFVDGQFQVESSVSLNDEVKEKMKQMQAYLQKDLQVAFPSKFENSKVRFGEEADLVQSSGTLSEQTGKTISGLSVIQEDVAAESQSAVEVVPDSSQQEIPPSEEVAPENNEPAEQPNQDQSEITNEKQKLNEISEVPVLDETS